MGKNKGGISYKWEKHILNLGKTYPKFGKNISYKWEKNLSKLPKFRKKSKVVNIY
jgi:hypothetical protein